MGCNKSIHDLSLNPRFGILTDVGYTGDEDEIDTSALPKEYVSFAFAFALQTGSISIITNDAVCRSHCDGVVRIYLDNRAKCPIVVVCYLY